MVSETRAREVAEAFALDDGISLAAGATESDRGWYFSWNEVLVGSHGLVVNKETGSVFVLGSAFPVDRDLRMYDQGMDAEKQDLVITAVNPSTTRWRSFVRSRRPSSNRRMSTGQSGEFRAA
jgi:hypothetical protein